MTLTFVHPPDGTRYYDLSAHTKEEAQQLAPELIAYSNLPCRMPDGRWLYPSRQPLTLTLTLYPLPL